MTNYEILRQGDPRIPTQLHKPPKQRAQRKSPTANNEFVRGNPGYLDPRIDPRVHVDTMAHALLEAQGQPTPGSLAYLDDPNANAPVELTTTQRERLAMNRGRSLVNPLTWSDVNLRRYLIHLTPLALSPSKVSTYPASMSPRQSMLLLGGIGIGELEELTERALEVLHFEDETVDPTLNYAMRLIGFGPKQMHLHADGIDLTQMVQRVGEDPSDYLKRIQATSPELPPLHFDSAKHGIASYYLRHTTGPFAAVMPHATDCYRYELFRKITRHKWWVLAKVRELFSPYSGPDGEGLITQANRDVIEPPGVWLGMTQPGHLEFASAVRMVFEQPWHTLDLTGNLKTDVVRTMAKLLIHRLSRNIRTPAGADNGAPCISARALVGISLLTGVPTPIYVRFAVDELKRRGETFLTADIVRRAVTLVDESEDVFQYASSEWMDEMHGLALQLEEHRHEPRAYFAKLLRNGSRILSSSSGAYQIEKFRDDGEPIFKPRINAKLMALHEEL